MDTKIPELNTAGLCRFAFTTSGLVAGLFGVVLPMLYHRPWPIWPWIAAVVLTLWGVFLPARLRMFYRGWMKLALILGRINSALLLSVLFVCIISPLGVLMRMFGYEPLHQRFLSHVPSYRKPSTIPRHNHMEKPY